MPRRPAALVDLVALAACLFAPVLSACFDPPWDVDLDGPRILRASLPGPRAIEAPVWGAIEIELSEPLDPATAGPGRIALVPWEEVGSCARTPLCERGSCERGRCMRDPLSNADLGRIDRGEHRPAIPIEITLDGPLLTVRPRRALPEHTRFSLVLGSGLRDRQGAPLVGDDGLRGRWRLDLVTAHEGSSGPEARLVAPAPGEVTPTNLAAIVTRFVRPFDLDALPGATLTLEGEDGAAIPLRPLHPCPGWVPGFCAVWAPTSTLAPRTRYRLGAGTLVDRRGRPAAPPSAVEWFLTGGGDDRTPPSVAGLWAELRGPCVHVGIVADEALTLSAQVRDHPGAALVAGAGPLEAALRLPLAALADAALRLDVELRDRADNHSTLTLALPAPLAEAPLPLVIAEVLANPAGPEPAQEFVELLDLRAEGPPLEVSGLSLADRSWPEVAALLAGGATVGDLVPAFTTRPGQRTVIVGAGYQRGDPRDPDPPADAALIRLGSSIGDAGLRAAGEPLTLFTAAPPALVAAFSPTIDTSKAGGQSVVLADPSGCDHPRAWRLHPLGASSPGWAP